MAIKSVASCFWMLLGIVAAVYAEPARPIFPYPYKTAVLENGLKVILMPMDSPGLAVYYSIVRTGSRDEVEPGHSGFAHFFEHMMFRGTKNFPGPLYEKLVTELGAKRNAGTTDDYTVYFLEFASGDLEQIFKLESDRFQNLSYAEDVFKTEAGAVHGEYLKSLSSPWMVLEEKLCATAFDKHTYRHTTMGFKKDIEAMPTLYQYSLSFFNRYYRPENVVLFIAGDIRGTETLELAKKYYGGWKAGYVPPNIPVEPEQKSERRAEVRFDGKTLPILTMAYKAPAFDPDRVEVAALSLLGELLFGETSEVYKKLVLAEQKVQFIQADFSANRDPRLAVVNTMVNDEKDVRSVEILFDQAVDRVRETPVDPKRLNDIKDNFKYGFLMNLDTPGKVAGNLSNTIAMTGGIEAIDRYFATLDRVTPRDIRDVAKSFLVREKRTVIVLKGRK